MRLTAVIFVPVVLIGGCNEKRTELSTPVHVKSNDLTTVAFCGGMAEPGVIQAYFHRLDASLSDASAAIPSELYDASIAAEDRPSRADWREISRRGAAALQDAGWRGCFLAHGKVWFEADGQSFVLKAFNRDLLWDSMDTQNKTPG